MLVKVAELLSAAGAALGGVAAWLGWFSPQSKARRDIRKDREHRNLEIHQALYGIPARHDDTGALIADPQPGLVADMRRLFSLPILNGDGTAALKRIEQLEAHMTEVGASVKQVNGRTLTFGRRLTAIEKAVSGDGHR